MPTATETWMTEALRTTAAQGRLRQLNPMPRTDGPLLNLSSNDYLNLTHHPAVIAAAQHSLADDGAGSGAARLVTGSLPCHARIEERLATLKQRQAALVFGSGYLANLGSIPALVGRDDTVYADRLIHASLVDAITLSRAHLRRFRHNDAAHLATCLASHTRGRALVVVESVYSMDGDLAPLADITTIAQRHEAMLFVDEAHATGIFGPLGSGRIQDVGGADSVNVAMGTLSKALGSYGGFVAGSVMLRELIINRARAFIYTTAPPPAAIGAALAALDLLQANPNWGPTLLARARRFRERLRNAGLDTMQSDSQIIPIRVGDSHKTLALSTHLRQQGLLAIAIRPPTVPEGSARLRLSITLAHTEAELDQAADTIATAAHRLGVPA